MMLVTACDISRRSKSARRPGVSGSWSTKAISGWATRIMNEHLPDGVGDVLAADRGFGMRAKDENSSTMRLMSSTWRTIVVGALVEDLAVAGDHLAVLAPDALGRELDRRQRVLDLVGDAPGDVGPGRGALRRDEVGDVVERDDEALLARRAPARS